MLPSIYTATEIRRYNASHVQTALLCLIPALPYARKGYDTSSESNTCHGEDVRAETTRHNTSTCFLIYHITDCYC